MGFTDTKESLPTMDNPHDHIILSRPLPSISKPQRRRIDISKWRDPSKQKYFSVPNLLENLHWSSFNNLYTGWSLSSTKIWPGFNSSVVFSKIFMQWYCVSSVCMGASIKGRIAEIPLRILPSPCSPNISCISCLKPCYFVWYSASINVPGVVRNVVGGNVEGMVSVCNGVRKFLAHV